MSSGQFGEIVKIIKIRGTVEDSITLRRTRTW